MKMKKFLALVLALGMILTLAACGSSSSSGSSAAASSATSSAASSSQESGSKGLTEAERAKEFITVGTGPTSGIYFPIGGAFAIVLFQLARGKREALKAA